MEIFDEIDKIRDHLALIKLTGEAKRKLDRKFHLEWSYHSNHMEGNTLTYGETQMLLFFGKATGDHEKREFDEMEAHDVAVKMIEEWAVDKTRDITETDVRQLNKIILVRPYWKEAITPEGNPTRKEIIPGVYKSSPNSVRLKNGQIHEYASPQETPILMKELFDKYTLNIQHPIIVAAWLHHQFVSIHPFDDGNGRVARLLTNYILMRYNYPPVIIKTESKEEYITALQKADLGDIEPFVQFLVNELRWSLDISIKASKGESIDEPGDLDKRIELLKRKLEKKDIATKPISTSSIYDVIKGSIFPLFQAFENKVEKLRDLFIDYDRRIQFTENGVQQILGDKTSSYEIIIQNWLDGNFAKNHKLLQFIEYSYQLKGFKKSVTHQYMSSTLHIQFNEYSYSLRIDNDYQKTLNYPYDSNLSDKEINSIISNMMESIIYQISAAGGLDRI